jgi:penicillin amidase
MFRILFVSGIVAVSAAPAFSAEPVTTESLLEQSKAVLAKIEGELSLPGLHKPVEVLRDNWGVPHIYAQDTWDLFYAQGVVAAQDRLFQLDLWRRTAVGELAEVLGPEAVARDRLARLVRFRGDMQAEWASYGPDAEQIARAFTTGINDYVASIGDKLPVEFTLAGFKPGRWRPEDVTGRMAGLIMVRNFQQEVARAELIDAVGFDKAASLLPTTPPLEWSLPQDLDVRGMNRDIVSIYKNATEKIRLAARAGDGDGFDEGSNNWVVSGARTESRMPILANDPHRPIQLPSLRYLVHLHAPGWNVIGAGEPALPGVAIGHNESIAWGITIVGTDQADLFVEEIKSDEPTRYRDGDDWREMEIVHETVNVKGAKPVDLELRYTRHGPVIYEDAGRHRAFALKWVGSEPGSAGYLGSLWLNRSKNWDDYRRAVTGWKVPSANLVYADKDGNIGWTATALTPQRRNGFGLVPVPGASKEYDWAGYLTENMLPREFNPKRGFIGTANSNILPDGYPFFISREWAPPYRQDRVREVLAGQSKHTIAQSQALQLDNLSLPSKKLTSLVYWVSEQDEALGPYRKLLREWNGDLSADSAAGVMYAFWLQQLLDDYYKPLVPRAQLDIVRNSAGVRPMIEDLYARTEELRREGPEGILHRTFAAAVKKAVAAQGEDPAKWRWGNLHTAKFTHPLSSLGDAYAKAFDRGPVPRSGDGFTAHATSYDADFRQTAGASYRQVFDLADWDQAVVTSVPGQSGQPGSPHYDDLLPLWAAGEYFPLKFTRPAVEGVTKHRLRLQPSR